MKENNQVHLRRINRGTSFGLEESQGRGLWDWKGEKASEHG